MKLSDKFDPNPMYTSDKIVVKHISEKETLLKLDLEPKCQGHSRKKIITWGTKNMRPQKNFLKCPLVIRVTPTRTPTAVKQYVDPNPRGGGRQPADAYS